MPGATAELLGRLARPYDPVVVMSALTGVSPAHASRLVGVSVATSREAEILLESFPVLLRSLATAVGTHARRCLGELRGPVLWSETLSARASSFGDQDLYVCATPERAHDIDQNRVLVAALATISTAASAVTARSDATEPHNDPLVEQALANGAQAARFAHHPSLKGVRRAKPTPRELKRTRNAKKRHLYRPAVEMLERGREPLGPEMLAAACEQRTLAQHEVLAAAMVELERCSPPVPALAVEDSQIYGGAIRYSHPNHAGSGRPAGVLVSQMLIDVPGPGGEAALAERAAGRPYALVRSVADIGSAVRQSISLAQAQIA